MEDSKIVQLYWNRNQNAIIETANKYGNYCMSIAHNILGNQEDADECVNDTYMSEWKSMPPHRPNILSIFLGKITRNLSFNRYSFKTWRYAIGRMLHLIILDVTQRLLNNPILWKYIK